MRSINLKVKPSKVYVLPHGGWLVQNLPTSHNTRNFNFVLVKPEGSVKSVGTGVLKYSPSLNQYLIDGTTSLRREVIVWSELGDVTKISGNKFVLARDSVHAANGIFVCTGTQALNAGNKSQEFKGRNRKLPDYYIPGDPDNIFKMLISAIPDFVVDAFVQGGKHKNTVFFMRSSTGENISIEAVGLGKLKTAIPSSDGLTALVVDNSGSALIIDNPL